MVESMRRNTVGQAVSDRLCLAIIYENSDMHSEQSIHFGRSSFFVIPQFNTIRMSIFLDNLSKEYAQEEILIVCDWAPWHKSDALVVPSNIHLIHIPPYTPEMNLIEQIWREVRTGEFRNEVFHSLEDVINRLCCTIKSITKETIRSITGRE